MPRINSAGISATLANPQNMKIEIAIETAVRMFRRRLRRRPLRISQQSFTIAASLRQFALGNNQRRRYNLVLCRAAQRSVFAVLRQILLDELHLRGPSTLVGGERFGAALERDLVEARLDDG